MPVDSIEEGLALLAVHQLQSDQIPDLAYLLFASGVQSNEMAALASPTKDEHPADLSYGLLAAITKAGIALPSRVSAANILKRLYAARCARGTLAPREAASMIVQLFYWIEDDLPPFRGYFGEQFGISALAGLFYSYDEYPYSAGESVRELERDIQQECARLATEDAA